MKREDGVVRDVGRVGICQKRLREFGAHLTSVEIFKKFILPEIQNLLYQYVWVDLFAGAGNLILPILAYIPVDERETFFKEHIILFDIQEKMVEQAVENACQYGIPERVAQRNIIMRDTLKDYPCFITDLPFPPFHITNPPYLYLGYIAKYSPRNVVYFSRENEGYQDLYQIALMNDLRQGIEKMIYILPTNFLFGFSVSNKIRDDFLPMYSIRKAIIFEKQMFEFTGTNVCVCFFERKRVLSKAANQFKAIKINTFSQQKKIYNLNPRNHYRAGSEFDEFVSNFKTASPVKIKFYLTLDEIKKHTGNIKVKLLDANNFSNGYYKIINYNIDQKLYKKIKFNPLFVRTLDTGKWEGRVGIYNIRATFGVDGIIVTNQKYRTHPIPIFLEPLLAKNDLELLKDYCNTMLEYFRDMTDSEFLTTFKYSNSKYIRKYLGLSQVKKLIETLPLQLMTKKHKNSLKILMEQKNINGIKELLLGLKRQETQLNLI